MLHPDRHLLPSGELEVVLQRKAVGNAKGGGEWVLNRQLPQQGQELGPHVLGDAFPMESRLVVLGWNLRGGTCQEGQGQRVQDRGADPSVLGAALPVSLPQSLIPCGGAAVVQRGHRRPVSLWEAWVWVLVGPCMSHVVVLHT